MLIPIQCEYYALEGLGQLLRNVDLVQAHLNPELHVSTILLTMYDGRTRLAAQVADGGARRTSATRCCATAIPRSVRVSEAPSYGADGDDLRSGLAGRPVLPRGRPRAGRQRGGGSPDARAKERVSMSATAGSAADSGR